MWAMFAVLLTLLGKGNIDAEQLFQRMEEKLAKAKTLECVFEANLDTHPFQGSLTLAKGNRVRLEIDHATKDRWMRVRMISDGTRMSYQDDGMSHPMVRETPKNLNAEIPTWLARPGLFLPQGPLPDVEAANGRDRSGSPTFGSATRRKSGIRRRSSWSISLSSRAKHPPSR